MSSASRRDSDDETALYMTMPTVLPITAPRTGTGMSAWPTKDDSPSHPDPPNSDFASYS